MSTPIATSQSPLKANRGLALLLVLTLLGFLLVLLLGLATYTRVETAVSGNTQRQAQARQHALLALDVALSQLQKFAGPDQRVTATGEATGGANAHYTGVWSSDPATASGTAPLTWLVSGSETPANSALTPQQLVGPQTAGTGNNAAFVTAPLVNIKTYGVPGQFANDTAATGGTTIGHYAWWVGDQGVKAPVAAADKSASVTYAPWDSAELRSRLRQQVALGPGAADSAGAPVFESRSTVNAPLLTADRVTAYGQLAFLRTPVSGQPQVGLAPLKTYYHAWSPNNFNVLANTSPSSTNLGLRQDLSLKPSLLGTAFAAWADYSNYMEDPAGSPLSPAPLQPYNTSAPVRRRYIMQPASANYPIGPVLSFFGLSFSIRNDSTTTNLEVACRSVIGLWNPFSSALIPDTSGYQLRITGLPSVTVTDTAATPRTVTVDLQNLVSNGDTSVKFYLPWSADSVNDDRSSWLPGRVYNWSADATTSGPGSDGYPTLFYVRAAAQGSGIVNTQATPLTVSTSSNVIYRQCSVSSQTKLTIALYRLSDGAKLAQFTSPAFDNFATSANVNDTNDKYLDFAFIFRMPDSSEIPAGETATWLQAAGRDPREVSFPSNGYVTPGGATNPATLAGTKKTTFDASYPDLLLDRYTDTASLNYNEDVPVFELPRSPLLSMGSLQHLRVSGFRPFSIGNSWGGSTLNAYFDQYFFSGLMTNSKWTALTQPLPNPQLLILKRQSDGSAVSVSDLNGAARQSDAYSAKYLLQGGAFNLNSVNAIAWSAVLRNVRFPSTTNFTYLNASTTTGTAADTTTTLADPYLTNSRVAVFPRFAQSAQEVFRADAGYTQSQFNGSTSVIDTPLFRRGIRALNATQITTLAQQIVALMQQQHAKSGPFRTLADFLTPDSSGLFTNAAGTSVSLLEKAIELAGLNDASNFDTPGVEFSSQWLTQGDIMTALAPVLFPRSDTFLIRSYGEAVNPTTGATEGRAWCEATVQRVPEYFDKTNAEEVAPSDPALTDLNKTFGRRFKIVSFRWLTRSDI